MHAFVDEVDVDVEGPVIQETWHINEEGEVEFAESSTCSYRPREPTPVWYWREDVRSFVVSEWLIIF